ncbi:hypothetical protein [Deinococcus aluminii]|uniref:Uncharacterized protein n=1 Tax=Deinococcus aluminii TaxID=1656885 RepID=A0ABP9XFG0_9DEIO
MTTTEAAFGEAVNFTMLASSVELSAEFLKPGGSYTVSIPVTNDTDRPITVNLLEIRKSGTYDGSLVTVTPTTSSVPLAAGGSITIEFTVKLPEDATIAKTASKTLTLTFDFEGVSDYSGQ